MHFCPIIGRTNSQSIAKVLQKIDIRKCYVDFLLASSIFAPSLGQPLMLRQASLRRFASAESHYAAESERHQHQRQHGIADGGTRILFLCSLITTGPWVT